MVRWLRSSDDEDELHADHQAEEPGTPAVEATEPERADRPSPWAADETTGMHPPSVDPPEVPLDLAQYGDEEVARAIRRAAARALAEDLGDRGDLTSAATVPAGTTGTARLVARARGVVSGLDVFVAVCQQVDERIDVRTDVGEGDRIGSGVTLATVVGPLRSILTAERSALNLLCHLSGIATRTRAFVDAVEGTGVTLRDTRKTVPGLRILEKRAVRAGGAKNHRLGLFDALLVKDNHIAAAGSLATAVEAALTRGEGRHVQVEVASFGQLEEAIRAGATDILLDNMAPDEVRQAVLRTRGRASLEASGNIDLETVRSYADTGVHRLAIGSLTHSAPWLDLALDVVAEALETPDWRAPTVWSEEDDGAGVADLADDVETAGLFAWRDRQGSD